MMKRGPRPTRTKDPVDWLKRYPKKGLDPDKVELIDYFTRNPDQLKRAAEAKQKSNKGSGGIELDEYTQVGR